MPKRIVFCSDGTWQTPLSNTNVYRIYKGLIQSSDQVAYYDDGVGADAAGLARVIGGAIAADFNEKILYGYNKIAHVYEPGDEIYLLGFSRGAYTVRSLGGMIASCGLPSGAFTDDCVTQVFAAYRDRANRASILAGLSGCGLADATIRMIGVWDTVGALGIPRPAQRCINQTGSRGCGKGSTKDQFVGGFEMSPARRSDVAAMIRTAITLPAALTRIGTV